MSYWWEQNKTKLPFGVYRSVLFTLFWTDVKQKMCNLFFTIFSWPRWLIDLKRLQVCQLKYIVDYSGCVRLAFPGGSCCAQLCGVFFFPGRIWADNYPMFVLEKLHIFFSWTTICRQLPLFFLEKNPSPFLGCISAPRASPKVTWFTTGTGSCCIVELIYITFICVS